MQYRIDPKTGNKLSVLGFGCMRFPSSQEKTEQLIISAIQSGVNYFDTAYIYRDSEKRLGEILVKHGVRNDIYIATKMPVIYMRKSEDLDRFFDAQLTRLQTGHIDYYLMHMLTDLNSWNQLQNWGVEEWIEKKKQSGKIRQIGFSFHGSQQEFLKILNAYNWDFCQIQYNYADEHNQAGVTGLKHAAEKGIPVVIMEPLLGGKLVSGLPKRALEVFNKSDSSITPAAWALKWLYNQPEVTVVLSGMNEQSQLDDNLKTAETAQAFMLDEKQIAVFGEVKSAFQATQKVSCTGCNYCMPCPHGVNIPSCFNAYNLSYSMDYMTAFKQYVMSNGGVATDQSGMASQCIECGKCEAHCPQNIEIRKKLTAVEKRFEPFWSKAGISIARKMFKRK